MAKRELTQKQQAFLDALFGPAQGDVRSAMDMAGYDKNTPQSKVVAALKEEILEGTLNALAENAPRAAFKMGSAVVDGTQLGIKESMAAAKEILDRVGIVKVERVEAQITAPNGIFLLPPKNEEPKDSDG